MPVFSLRPAPSLRWVARASEPCGVPTNSPADEGTTRVAACGLALPSAFALRLEARQHVKPTGTARCPLDASTLRQWCVRRQRGSCPEEAGAQAPVFLRSGGETPVTSIHGSPHTRARLPDPQ
ncbi:hypothetical protein [Paraburkholderia tropica]|uniref:hypothetical protein n=1 Tax=Paraburkholderia tropica TaxID=92647 RepID=UPI0015926183|nr:hypothetical protein [Paraburkholderia tropica]QNB13106.1 hypothetical protein G5S35_15665 [Paraburkholderia tropica]